MTNWQISQDDLSERWEILDSEGSIHSQHSSRGYALEIAAMEADDNEALAVELRGQADEAQEIADGLRGLLDRAGT